MTVRPFGWLFAKKYSPIKYQAKQRDANQRERNKTYDYIYSPFTKVRIPNGITKMATIRSVMANDMRK